MIMMSQDFEMSPRTKASNASIRRGKIEKMRMDNSATTIQALWRGAIKRRAYKKRLLRNGSRQPKHKICDSGVAPIELKNIRPEPILSKTMISSARSTLASSSSRKLVESQRDDDDDGCLERDDMDDEEALAVSAAEHFEERLIRLASLRNLVPTWPDALSDDFDDPEWPDLETASSTLDGKDNIRNILIRAVTWNLCARKPPPAVVCRQKLFPLNKFHLYIIGSEECERSIAQSAVNTSKKAWEAHLTEILGPMYVPLRSHTLQAIHIVAFAHLSIANMCSDIASAAVATGMGNTLGNKGAVAISMKIGRTRFVFANAHLAAHQNAVKQRNSDYAKISKEMPILLYKSEIKSRARAEWRISRNSNSKNRKNNSIVPSSPAPNGEALTTFSAGPSPATPFEDTSTRFDADGLDAPAFFPELDEAAERVIFMGDLNYRIRGNRSVVSKLLQMDMHEVMLSNDQLISCMERNLVLKNFTEPPLNFRPTYKLDPNSDEYDTGAKKRIPAWTDRILYIKKKGFTCTAYDSDQSLKTSDHRPVFASFSSAIEISKVEEMDEPLRDSAELDRSHPEFSSETQVCSVM